MVYLAGPDTRYKRTTAIRKILRIMKLKITRPKSLLSSYQTYMSPRSESKTFDWDFPVHMTPSTESKTFIAKDHVFLQKLEEKLKDPTVSCVFTTVQLLVRNYTD